MVEYIIESPIRRVTLEITRYDDATVKEIDAKVEVIQYMRLNDRNLVCRGIQWVYLHDWGLAKEQVKNNIKIAMEKAYAEATTYMKKLSGLIDSVCDAVKEQDAILEIKIIDEDDC